MVWSKVGTREKSFIFRLKISNPSDARSEDLRLDCLFKIQSEAKAVFTKIQPSTDISK